MFGAYGRDAMLAGSGVTIDARITGIEPAPDLHDDLFRVAYAFAAPDGETITASRPQWRWQVDELKKTGIVPVTYMPDNPSFHLMDHAFDLDDTLGLFGQYFAILAVGIWGAGKNLGFWRRSSPSAPRSRRRPPIRDCAPSLSRAPRPARPSAAASFPALPPRGRLRPARRMLLCFACSPPRCFC